MSHKRRIPESSPGVQLSLIITPMLDMAFQILAFFIMTYHPSALEGHIPGSLVPPDNFAKKSKDNVPLPAEAPLSIPEDDLLPELQEAITVKVKAIVKGSEKGARIEGMPEQIFIKTGLEADYRPPISDIDTEWDRALDRLTAELKGMLGKGATKDAHLKIAADGELRQQYVMAVYDTAKKAGFKKIHFVPPPVLNAKIKN